MLDMLQTASDVRLAEPDDEDNIVDLCRRMLTEMAQPCDETKTRLIVRSAIPYGRNDPESGSAWIGVIGDVGELKGTVYLTVQMPWHSTTPYLGQLWNFVAPEHRKSSHYTKQLMTFAQGTAERLRMELKAGVMSTGPGMERLYERMPGFERVGAIYSFAGCSQ